jgi:TonB family protein
MFNHTGRATLRELDPPNETQNYHFQSASSAVDPMGQKRETQHTQMEVVMRFFRAALILALCGLLGGTLTAAQDSQTSETRTNALTNKDVLEMLRAGLSQEVVIAKIESSASNLDTSPTGLKELKTAHVPKKVILAMVHAPAVASPSDAQVAAKAPANTGSRRIQNIAPEEMWKRVTQCVLPANSNLAFANYVSGTVDIGLGISPEGDVANTSRVLDGPPLLVASAMDAIRQWKFRPNMVQGEVTWSRVRALVHFNADGTTGVELVPAILADNFGDPGTPRSAATAFPKPEAAPECKSAQASTGAVDQFTAASGQGAEEGPFRPNMNGVGYPSCIYCPDPAYSEEARNANIQGTILLSAVIGADGHAANIKVVKSLGHGLDEKAAETLETWRFKPALGPNGNPVATITTIEVIFRILKN